MSLALISKKKVKILEEDNKNIQNENGETGIDNENEKLAGLDIFSNFKDIDRILNSKFAQIYLILLEETLKNKLRESTLSNINHKETSKPWIEIYSDCLMNNTFNGHIPVLVYKYILAKVKIKYKQLKRESEKYENKIDDFVNFYIKHAQIQRNKIVENKRKIGIELEKTHYFPRDKVKGFTGILKARMENFMNVADSTENINIKTMFNFNTKLMKAKEMTSEERRALAVHFEQIKQKLEDNKKSIEVKVGKTKKYNHIKSKLHESTECREITFKDRKNSSSQSPRKSTLRINNTYLSSNTYTHSSNQINSQTTTQNSSPMKIKKILLTSNKKGITNTSPSIQMLSSDKKLNLNSDIQNNTYNNQDYTYTPSKSTILNKVNSPSVNKFSLRRKMLNDPNKIFTISPKHHITDFNLENFIKINNTESIEIIDNLEKIQILENTEKIHTRSIESCIFKKIKKNELSKENINTYFPKYSSEGHLPILDNILSSKIKHSKVKPKAKNLISIKKINFTGTKNYDYFSKNDFYYK